MDDETSASQRRAGLVLTGKLATPEYGILPVAETQVGRPTRNPWDPDRTAGGSSAGSGAAVAARMLPLAAGSDGAGSIRIPSALCGLVGLKTTRGHVPNPLDRFETVGIAVIGPMARDAADAAALLDVLRGHHDHVGPALAGLERPPERLRAAVSLDSNMLPTAPGAREAVGRVVRALTALGHTVDEGPILDGDIEEFMPVYRHIFSRTPVIRPSGLESTSVWLREAGRHVRYGDAIAARDRITWRVHRQLAAWDLWVTPVVAIEPPRVGEAAHLAGEARFYELARLGIWTAALNASGNPAVSVPVLVDGRPWGVQIAGHPGDDERLLALAHAILAELGTPHGLPRPGAST